LVAIFACFFSRIWLDDLSVWFDAVKLPTTDDMPAIPNAAETIPETFSTVWLATVSIKEVTSNTERRVTFETFKKETILIMIFPQIPHIMMGFSSSL
jgi:hypothetical protein